ncbi:MAG: undecaprenyl-phosphate galactose phosphotransferase WbaP [candidate division WOR-3 bacterium]
MLRRFRSLVVALILLVADASALIASYCLAYAFRTLILSQVLGWLPFPMPFASMVQRWYLLLAYLPAFAYEGLYTKRLVDWEEIRRCFRAITAASAAVVALVFALRYLELSRFVIALAYVLTLAIVPTTRAAVRRLLVKARLLSRGMILIGNHSHAAAFVQELSHHTGLGYEVEALVERTGNNEPVSELLSSAKGASPDAILTVLADSFTTDEMATIILNAEERFSDLMLVPSAALLRTHAVDIEQIGSTLVVRYRYNLLRPINRCVKRIVELVICSLLCVVLVPLFLLLAVLTKLSSPGPILFAQTRIGRQCRYFRCYKFRTMHAQAEAELIRLLAENPTLRAEYSKYAKIANDPRATKLGRVLRRFGLDELPQLWNVLRGDMALVGPRPYMPSETEQIGTALETITRVRPGITGLWQVSGRSELPFRERVILDEYYIRNWSLWMDLSILLRTGWIVVTGSGSV